MTARATSRRNRRGVVAAPGVQVTVEGEAGREVVRVRDGEGRMVFEHRAAEGRSVVYAPAGDLELRAERGSIVLDAAEGVRVRAGDVVDLAGARAVRVATPSLDARALRAELAAGEARLVARTVSTAVEAARHVVGVVETQATRIVERARNAYREVEELAQTRAGRMRLVAETTFHVLGRRTLLKAEEDMKLKGEKIHLG